MRHDQLIPCFLISCGLKRTRGRSIILKELENQKDHFNAKELYLILNQKGVKISRPTIYRTLKLLEKFHIIKKFDIQKNCFYYEPAFRKKDHAHLICQYCGKVMDFTSGSIKSLKLELAKEKVFKMENISIHVFGICETCQKNSEVDFKERKRC